MLQLASGMGRLGTESAFEVLARAKALEAQGKSIISLSIGQPDFQTPAHIVEVTYNPATGTSTWVDRSFNFGDLPVNVLVRDDVTGDLYAGTDFGALRLASGTTTWTTSAPGLPNVEVTSLEIIPSERILYAATHGLSTWRLNLD